MKKIKHQGLELVGLILIYVTFPFVFFANEMIISLFKSMTMSTNYMYARWFIRGISGNLAIITLVIAILYHTNVIKNYLYPAIFAFFVNPISAILIFIGHSQTSTSTPSLELRLQELDKIYQDGLMTKDEYETKRAKIIDQYLQ